MDEEYEKTAESIVGAIREHFPSVLFILRHGSWGTPDFRVESAPIGPSKSDIDIAFMLPDGEMEKPEIVDRLSKTKQEMRKKVHGRVIDISPLNLRTEFSVAMVLITGKALFVRDASTKDRLAELIENCKNEYGQTERDILPLKIDLVIPKVKEGLASARGIYGANENMVWDENNEAAITVYSSITGIYRALNPCYKYLAREYNYHDWGASFAWHLKEKGYLTKEEAESMFIMLDLTSKTIDSGRYYDFQHIEGFAQDDFYHVENTINSLAKLSSGLRHSAKR